MRDSILRLTSQHIDLEFLFTPIAVKVAHISQKHMNVKMIYLFGIRIYRQGIYS